MPIRDTVTIAEWLNIYIYERFCIILMCMVHFCQICQINCIEYSVYKHTEPN